MSVDATARQAVPRILAERYRRVRTAHPVSVLAWLRNGVLLCVLATALLYLWVAIQAGNDIAAANRTSQGIAYLGEAEAAANSANDALSSVFKNEDVALTGTGSEYPNEVTAIGKFLAFAAEDNAAGQIGINGIQFAQDQFEQYLQLSENAVLDYGIDPKLGRATETYAPDIGLPSTLGNLETIEIASLGGQRGAWPLDPGVFWLALLGPVVGLFLLIVATAHVLASHFRRNVSRWLWGSLLVTVATAITAGLFNTSDEQSHSPDPWAGHPVTLMCALLLFLLAAVLAHLAYRPRLAEYRFEPS